MSPFSILRDSWYFVRHNLGAIVVLCLPLMCLEVFAQYALDTWMPRSPAPWNLVVLPFFYPLYEAALILFLAARSRGEHPKPRDLLAASIMLWPRFAVLTSLVLLLTLLGFSLLLIPGILVMVSMAFSEYLLTLRRLEPLAAMRASLEMSRGHRVVIFTCLASVTVPVWVLEGLTNAAHAPPMAGIALDCLTSFMGQFTTVVIYRLFMLISDESRQ